MMRPLLLLAALAMPLAAQSASFTPDRPAAARAALRRAALAQRGGQADTALAEALAAADAWPVQPAYLEAALRLASAAGDTTIAARLLHQLARLESGQAALATPGLEALAARSGTVAAARTALERALRATDGATQVLTIPDTTWFPEGLARDPVTGTLYVTSLRHRTIGWVTPEGTLRPLLASVTPAPLAPYAVVVDSARRLLYAATGVAPAMLGRVPADSTRAELLCITLADGRITGRWPLADGLTTPGEMALLPNGDILVSDALRGALHRWRAATGTWATRRDPWLRSPQGLAPSADGRVVYVADWSTGLLRWDLGSDSLTRVMEPAGTTLVGMDGLRRAGAVLVGVQNGLAPARVVRISLSPDGRRATAVTTLDRPLLDGDPTTGVVADGTFLYVATSQWPHWDDDGRRRADKPGLPPVILRHVPLDSSASSGIAP